MAESQAEIGYDDRFQFEVEAGSGVYADIEEVKDYPEFGDDFEKVAVTHHTSPGRRKEYKAGMSDAAEISVEANYIRGPVQEALIAAAGTVRNFRNIYKTTPPLQITYPALILSAKPTSPTEDVRKLMIKIQPTGDFEREDLES